MEEPFGSTHETRPEAAAFREGGNMQYPNIEILLSTWNGEDFISELLESLLKQDVGPRLRILVRDDGSTDSTTKILQSFATRDNRIHVVLGENVGVRESFHALMNLASPECSLFMFCDQDDIWLPTKVSSAASAMTQMVDLDTPCLYCSRSMIVNERLEQEGLTDYYAKPSFRQALVQGVAPGHTMMFNRSLLDLAKEHFPTNSVVMHDFWLFLIAAGLGRVVFDPGWYSLYRMHSGNVLGYSSNPLRRFFTNLVNLFQFDFHIYARQAAAFQEFFGQDLDSDDKAALSGFVDQGGFLDRLRYVYRFGINYGGKLGSLAGSFLFVAGRYRLIG